MADSLDVDFSATTNQPETVGYVYFETRDAIRIHDIFTVLKDIQDEIWIEFAPDGIHIYLLSKSRTCFVSVFINGNAPNVTTYTINKNIIMLGASSKEIYKALVMAESTYGLSISYTENQSSFSLVLNELISTGEKLSYDICALQSVKDDTGTSQRPPNNIEFDDSFTINTQRFCKYLKPAKTWERDATFVYDGENLVIKFGMATDSIQGTFTLKVNDPNVLAAKVEETTTEENAINMDLDDLIEKTEKTEADLKKQQVFQSTQRRVLGCGSQPFTYTYPAANMCILLKAGSTNISSKVSLKFHGKKIQAPLVVTFQIENDLGHMKFYIPPVITD